MRRAAARLLLLAGAVWLAVLLAAALTGGWRFGAVSITSAKPLRFALLALLAGALLLPAEDRERITARVSPRKALLGGLAFAALYGLVLRVTRWLAFDDAAFDLTLFESTLHHTLQGRFMHAWGLDRSLFSEHFEPIVLFHLPLWAPFRHPMVLQLTESLAVTLAAVPLYRSARVLGLDARLAALTAAAYLLNPFVWAGNRDFHPEMFGPLAVFWALHASLTRRWGSLYAALAFALCLKEEMALVMACFAVLVLRGPGARRWPRALAVAALSLAWGVATLKLIMPAFHPEGAELHPLASRWAHLGSTYPQMALGVFGRPGWAAGLLFHEAPLTLLGSFGFVPLADPLGLVAALPPLYLHLMGDYEPAAQLIGYYGVFVTSLLFAATLFALERVRRRLGERAALVVAVLPLVAMPALPFLVRPTAADLHAAAFMRREVPETDVVCAQSPLAPHRAPDVKTLRLVPDCEGARWVLLAKEHDRWPLIERAEYDAFVQGQLARGLSVRFEEGDYLFLQAPAP